MMDAQRFDNLARTLASRLSRRGALRRAGAGAAASLLAATGIRPEQAAALVQAQGDGKPLYTLIRRYTLGVPSGQVRQALQQGYVEDACTAPGFVAYLTVEDEDGDFATVAVFRSQADLENFANAEANWIAQNLEDLLPAPDEAISGDTYVHGVAPQGFSNTCPAGPAPTVPPAPTTGPAPTSGPAPTAVPSGPTPTPAPACTGQGCVCATGAQSPCDDGFICCPTTDLMGGPGVCQTEAVCHPNDCRTNGRSCPRSCGATEACPSCCSNYCNGDGVCDDPPAPCASEGCTCTTGTQSACDDGLICCGMSGGIPGDNGTCKTEAACNTPCTGENCDCDNSDPNSCDQGLTCCAVQAGYICVTVAQCSPGPCTAEGCDCTTGTQSPCDDGLICCGTSGVPGGSGTCQTEAECDPPCTSQGCDCNGGVLGACDTGLVCCQGGVAIPGGAGTCQPESQCPPPPCTGEGCACNGGVQGNCDDGLVCCQGGQSIPGGPGACQPADACGPPPCTDNGTGCDATCNWGDSCGGCCSGFCNSSGACDDAPPVVCTSAGCACDTGTDSPCDDGLTCCASGDLIGGPGVCQEGC